MKEKKEKKEKAKKNKFSKRHPKIALTIRIIILILVILLVVGTGAVVGIIYGVWNDEFEISEEELLVLGNSVVLDSDGNVLAELKGDENRKVIKLDEMAEYLPNAYVAIEDERFYEHEGVDIKRTGAAIFTYITHRGSSSFGGSTITQQLVKNITQEDDKTGIEGIKRKIKEWAKAYQIEDMLSKQQILELYLNIIFIGGGKNYHGVEVGAEYYFGKTAKELSLVECAFMAGINNAPNSYNPYGKYPYGEDENKTKLVNTRTKTVLGKMLELNFINQEEYNEAIAQIDENGIEFKEETKGGNIYSYHTDATIAKVIADIAEEKNWSKDYATTYVYGGGLTIYSTQDTSVQEEMEKVMQTNGSDFSKKGNEKNADGEYEYSQAATVVIDNETGYAVGIVGGLGEKKESRGLNRATQSPRQTGSSIKPLADVLPALEQRIITASTMYDDCETEFPATPKPYKPTDEGAYKGIISVRSAITTSQNVPFVKIMAELTNEVSREYLSKMGITSIDPEHDSGLSLAIGGQYKGVTALEMAAGYATIENDGVYREPLLYTKIIDSQGNVVIDKEQKTERVCSEQNAYIIKDLLKSVVTASNGTATYCKISGIDVAAKTGTTNDRKDRWLCGFTNYYTAATWYGYDTPEYMSKSGTNPAGLIFKAVMTPLHKDKEKSTFKEPEGIVTVKVCNHTGLKATDKCSETHNEIFVKGTEPEECDEISSAVQICDDTGKIATEYCPNVTTQYFSYTIPKERLGLWKNLKKSGTEAPEETCTEHTAETSGISLEPEITLNGEETITLKVGEKYTEQGAKATDRTDGDITNKVQITGSVNTSKAGTYTITYKVKNSLNLETSKKRTVVVEAIEEKPTNTTDGNTTTPTKPTTNENTTKPAETNENTVNPEKPTKPTENTTSGNTTNTTNTIDTGNTTNTTNTVENTIENTL